MKGLDAINHELRNYRNIFTTNYDLIPYWSIMLEDTWRFKDLFWGEGNTFDLGNTSVNADRSVISYLHGAIHLVELPNGKTKKLTANGLNSLVDLFDLDHPEYFPLFISEGTSAHKLSRIKRNDYLRFSFEKFQALDGNLVALGQSLNKDFDQHLLDALRDSDLASIAVGVWPNQEQEKILEFKARVLAEIGKKEIYFFDSTTHPLGVSALRHEVQLEVFFNFEHRRFILSDHMNKDEGMILTLQRILGHSSLAMTMKYAHLAPDHLQEAVRLNLLSFAS